MDMTTSERSTGGQRGQVFSFFFGLVRQLRASGGGSSFGLEARLNWREGGVVGRSGCSCPLGLGLRGLGVLLHVLVGWENGV